MCSPLLFCALLCPAVLCDAGPSLLCCAVPCCAVHCARTKHAPGLAASIRFGQPPEGRIVAETPEEKALSEYVFLSKTIPWWVSVGGYAIFLIIGTAVIPQLYPQAKW